MVGIILTSDSDETGEGSEQGDGVEQGGRLIPQGGSTGGSDRTGGIVRQGGLGKGEEGEVEFVSYWRIGSKEEWDAGTDRFRESLRHLVLTAEKAKEEAEGLIEALGGGWDGSGDPDREEGIGK